MFLVTITILTLLVTLYHLWSKHKFDYWSKRGINGPRSAFLLPSGHFKSLWNLQETIVEVTKKYYDQFPNDPAVGLYLGYIPILLVKDPQWVQQILIKNYDMFRDRGLLKELVKRKSLVISISDYWQTLKQHLRPAFSSGKLKTMVPMILQCCDDYLKFIDSNIEINSDHEIKSLTSRFAAAVTGTCLLGIDTESFTDKSNPYIEMSNSFFSLKPKTFVQAAMEIVTSILEKYFGIKQIHADDMYVFCSDLLKSLLRQRENVQNTKKDFIDLLKGLKEKGQVKRTSGNRIHTIEINDNILTNSLATFITGLETTGSEIALIFHELAFYPDIQEKAFNEIKDITEKYNGILTYEALQDMTYLRMIFDESLRKYSGISFRVANENFTFCDTNVRIEKGTYVMIPNGLLHMDPKYFENPHVFDPERFSPENQTKLPACVYLPFGAGPRQCIASRFATLQALALLATFLNRYTVEPTEKTVRHLKMDPSTLSAQSLSGLWLKISRRN